jgi:two-component system NarL family sensor kinase
MHYMPSTAEELRIAIITTSILMFFLVAFILFLFFVFQLRKRKAQAILEKEILAAQIEIQEQTFKNVSQEIHDNVGQVLSLAKLNLNSFLHVANEKENSKMESTRQLISKAIGDLRNLSRSMQGNKISETGLQAAIKNELSILEDTGQYETKLEVIGAEFRLDMQKEMMLFRMVQEAITNCIKYAKAKNIKVKIENHDDRYAVSVQDDGIGFDITNLQSDKTGIGLRNMQNRATLIRASLVINSVLKQGTTIEIVLLK